MPPYNLDEAQIALILFAYIFGVVASPLAGTWAGRIGQGPMLVIGAATGAADLALTLLAPLVVIVVGVCLVTIVLRHPLRGQRISGPVGQWQ